MFAVRIADGIATGIWASSVLSTYINVLEGADDHANEKVGYAQAIQGTFLAAAALPAGWLAIKHRRDSILKVFGLVAFAAIATTSAALVLNGPYKYWLLCCGLALWGVAQANAPVLDALFADSVPTGSRSTLYTWLHMSYIVSQGLGPGVAAVMFYMNGNVWRLEVLQRVMLAGMAVAAVPALLMLCFDDDQSLGAESEGLLKVALLREEGSDADSRAYDEEAYGRGGGARGDPDYRRPFLDGWSSDVERDYRNQVSPAISPARPVFAAVAAAAAAAASSNGNGHGYVPPKLNAATRDGADISAARAQPPPVLVVSEAAAAGQLVSSHALMLSPSMSPTTDRSGLTTPTGASPPPGGNSYSCDRIVHAAGGPADGLFNAVAAAAAAKLWRAGAEEEDEGAPRSNQRAISRGGALPVAGVAEGTGVAPPATAAAAAATTTLAERFHAVWQAVDGAAVAEPPPLPEAAPAEAQQAPAAALLLPSFSACRSVSIVGGVVPAIDFPAAAAAATTAERSGSGGGASRGGRGGSGGGAGDGEDSGTGGSQAQSVSGESAPSELSFSSLLAPGNFKSAVFRPYSRTASSSSCGSGRGGSSGGAPGNVVLGPPPLGLLPYPEEDLVAEADAGEDPSTPTLEVPRSGGPERQPATHKSLVAPAPPALLPAPLAAAAAAAIAAGRASGGGDGASSASGGSPTNAPRVGPQADVAKAGSLLSRRDGQGALVPADRRGGAVAAGGRAAGGRDAREPVPQLSALGGGEVQDYRFLCLTMAWIPGLLALTDCILGLASGMTIKFFPIFFKDAVELQPMYVNLMYCAIPVCLSTAAFLAQRQSRWMGRVPTMVVNRGIGIALLYWIATHADRWHEPKLMVPVYILRTSVMNSIYPLRKSILMDFVPKESRAAWNSLEAVTGFGWSGSAALGGWLIHRFGFQVTFLITATVQGIGWALSMLLLPIVPIKETSVQAARRLPGGVHGGSTTSSRPSPRQPHEAAGGPISRRLSSERVHG